MRIVVDTNVLVSALMNFNGIPAQILNSIINNDNNLLYDNKIIFEYINVLSRKEFGFNTEIINKLLQHIRVYGEYVITSISNIKFSDESDRKFYEVYKSGNAMYLITGNKRHFKETGIVTPREFIDNLYR
jgi:putative PIN family toxin of toxin-antitoxin system